MNILVIGSGGREHAFCLSLSQSNSCKSLFAMPGNAGISQVATCLDGKVSDFLSIKQAALTHDIDLIVVGPEVPLVEGIVNFLQTDQETAHVRVLGPDKSAAMLEGSKDFAKAFMERYDIPTARYKTFITGQTNEASEFLRTMKPPYVLKADGLAAGKGVVIENDFDRAVEVIDSMLSGENFGEAGTKVVIEEFLSGIELSAFVLTDGSKYTVLPYAKDYKRIGENDEGANTGGMGSISPVPFLDDDLVSRIESKVLEPTIRGIKEQGFRYRGFIFVGLMISEGEPYVIEYNVRMGDPETQSVFSRLQGDMAKVLWSAADGDLDDQMLSVDPKTAATVVLVAGGYPGSYTKGDEIKGLDDVSDSVIYHAGTTFDSSGKTVTNGGRVLAVCGKDDTLQGALERAYRDSDKIQWENLYKRRDLGKDLLKFTT